MKFLNTNPKRQFRQYKNLYAYGYSDYEDWEVLEAIETGENFLPHGQFAYIWIKDGEYFFMCDHLCTTNIYYTDKYVTSSYDQITKVIEDETPCKIYHEQIELLKTHTVGPFTPYESIKRVEPDHYVDASGSHMYFDSMNIQTNVNPDEDAAMHYLYNFAQRIPENPVVAFSGGKDSYLVAQLPKRYGKNPKLIKVHSENVTNRIDINAVDEYIQNGWEIEKFEIPGRKSFITNQFNHDFWRDGCFNVKQAAVKNKGSLALSGEVGGDSPKNKHFALYLENIKNPKVEDLIKIWISINGSFLKDHSMKGYDKHYNSDGYGYILDYWTSKWKRLDCKEKAFRLFFQEHSSYRLWGESQDDKNTWLNMYADPDIFFHWLSYPESYKVEKQHMKKIGLKLGGTDISWKYKTIGMSILK